jgi:hypothetical protein
MSNTEEEISSSSLISDDQNSKIEPSLLEIAAEPALSDFDEAVLKEYDVLLFYFK